MLRLLSKLLMAKIQRQKLKTKSPSLVRAMTRKAVSRKI
jgi:hypothetical protein